MKKFLTLLTFLCVTLFSCTTKTTRYTVPGIQAPYKSISGTFSGMQVAHSPDPLVALRWENPRWTDSLEVYVLTPARVIADNTENVSIKNNTSMTVNGACNLLFDFGRVSAAWFEFEAPEIDGEIEMSISEFNEPAVFNLGSQHPKKTAAPTRHGNTWRLELNKELYEGVRYAWIHIHSLNKPLDISSVRLVCQTKPTNYEGSFACSDTMLTRIWYTGAYTVKTNLLQDYFGAILMERSDRHSWTGDAHTSQAASMVAFGNFDFVKQNLRYTSTQYNGIASYSLYWILSLIDYYMYTGDKELLDEMLENACNKLDKAYEHYGDDANIVFYGWDERLGAGFENGNNTETRNAYKMLSIQTWSKFSQVMKKAGYVDIAGKYEQYANEKITLLGNIKDWNSNFGLHAAADAINASFLNEPEQNDLIKRTFSDRQQRLSYSPFNQYFIIQALTKAGLYNEALNTIDDCWGGQIRYGATTFFEVFRPSWNDISAPNDAPVNNQCGYTSLTHPWSAGVTKWLSEEILGVKPTRAGFQSYLFKPHLSSKVSWIKGKVPTLNGTIEVSGDMNTGKFSLTVPPNTTADVAIPKAGYTIGDIRFNKEAIHKTGEDEEFVYYTGFTPGKYSIKVNYQGHPKVWNDEPFVYHNRTILEDTDTQGNWHGKYGSKGYVLCNYDNKGNRTQLPDYISDLKFTRNANTNWATATEDIRALQSADNGTTRHIGAIYTQDPNVCMQTITVDLSGKVDQPYQLSLYFVDWDRQERRSALEVFDLNTKELLMPVYMVRNYEEGKYVTFTVDRPVRIRVDHVRGSNAALSALFFD